VNPEFHRSAASQACQPKRSHKTGGRHGENKANHGEPAVGKPEIATGGGAYRPIDGPPLVARIGLAILKAQHSPVAANLMSLIA